MTRLLAAAGIAGLVFLAGCAPQPLTRADVDGRIVCDADRMARVEEVAKRNGTELHWVNCPTAVLRAS